MSRFKWESERKIQDVINDLIALKGKSGIIGRIVGNYIIFKHKYLGTEGFEFTLYFRGAGTNWASYEPAPIKGIIKPTENGCKVEAHQQRWFTVINNILFALYNIVFYVLALAAPIAGFNGWVIVSVLAGTIAVGVSIWFFYTAKKWKSKNGLLNTLDRILDVKRQQC